MSKLKRVCVFSGSSPGAQPEYLKAARTLGHLLVERNYELVYGGANVGLMAAVADAVLERKGHVIGIIPEALVEKEVCHRGLSDLRIVVSMHERKNLMAELSDGFIALPGGIGTLEEFFEVLTWAQLGMHGKPCGLLNVCDYYEDLLRFLDHSVQERFLTPIHRGMLLMEKEPRILLDGFESFVSPKTDKWIDRNKT